MFFNHCKCECEKEIIRTELIVIAREYSPTKIKPLVGGVNRLATVALQPKQMEVNNNKRNAFKERRSSLFQIHQTQNNKSKEHGIFPIFSSKESVSTLAMSENPKTLSIKNSQQMLMAKQYGQSQQLYGRVVKGYSEEEQAQRRATLKINNNNAGNLKRELDSNNSLTTKRYKKRQSIINLLESNKQTSLPLILQIANLHDNESNKENLPNSASQNSIITIQNENTKTEKVITLMKEEISILKSQLLRLENDEKALINEKKLNQKFFQEDYAINQRKKQHLKRNCNQRSQQLKQLKQLLVQCRNRNL